MKLHRVGTKPDWEAVRASKRTYWQRLAAQTHGVVTPGNIATLMGCVIVLSGLMALLAHYYLVGLGLVLVGRLADIADGWLAERTRTKSHLGEMLDASADKVLTFLTLLTLYIAQIAPGWILVLLAIPHIIIAIVTLIGAKLSRRPHPSRVGKLSMFTLGVSTVGFIMLQVTDYNDAIGVLSYVAAGVSCMLGLIALLGYLRSVAGLDN